MERGELESLGANGQRVPAAEAKQLHARVGLRRRSFERGQPARRPLSNPRNMQRLIEEPFALVENNCLSSSILKARTVFLTSDIWRNGVFFTSAVVIHECGCYSRANAPSAMPNRAV